MFWNVYALSVSMLRAFHFEAILEYHVSEVKKEDFMNNFTKFIEAVKGNALFALEFLGVMLAIFLIAYVAEKIILKRTGDKEKILSTRKIAVVGMFSAIAGVLMAVEVPLPGVIPEFYKFEIGDLPGIICGFAYGPIAGVLVEMFKVFIKVLIFRPTSTAFVGELANFVIGCSLVLPATIVYWCKKTKKGAVAACVIGGLCMCIVGSLLNGLYLLPTFVRMFFGGDLETLISVGSATNPMIKNIPTFVIFAALPMNFLKSVAVGILAMLLYKPFRPFMKESRPFKKKKKE